MSQEDSQSKEDEVLGFLEKVARELTKREARVFEVEAEIKKIEAELSTLVDGRLIRSGNSSAISVASGYKDALGQKLKAKQLEHKAAQSEVEKARERQKLAKLELAELQAKRTGV